LAGCDQKKTADGCYRAVCCFYIFGNFIQIGVKNIAYVCYNNHRDFNCYTIFKILETFEGCVMPMRNDEKDFEKNIFTEEKSK